MLVPIDNQPVKFIEGDYIGYEAEGQRCKQYAPPWCQMVETDDETNFQVKICDFDDDVELVDNGDFSDAAGWVVTGGWAIQTGVPQAINAAGTAGVLSRTIDADLLIAGHSYIVRFRIEDWDDQASGNSAFVRLGGTEVIELTTAGSEEGDYIITVTLETLTDFLFSVTSEASVKIGIHDVSVIGAPCTIKQLVTNPTFNDPGTPWNYGGAWEYLSDDGSGVSGAAQMGVGSTGVLSDVIDIKAGCMYRVEFKILDNSMSGSETIKVKLGGVLIFTIDVNTAVGVHTVYKYLSNVIPGLIPGLIEFDSDTGEDFIIDNILVWELSGMGFDVKDIKNDISVLVGEGTHFEDFAQGSVDWSGIAVDCYKICVYDICRNNRNLILNGTFDDTSVWNVSGEWSIIGGEAVVNGTGGGTLDQDITLIAKTLWRVTYEVTQFGAGGVANVDIELNDQIIQTVGVTTFTGTYSHIVKIDTLVNNKLEFVINADGNVLQFKVDNIKVEQLTGCGSEEQVTNGQFSNDSDFILGGNWVISGGTLSNIVSTASDIASQLLNLQPNIEYTLSIEMVSFVSPFNVLKIRFDGVQLLIIDTTTDVTGTFTATFTTDVVISSQLLELDVAINNGMTFDNLSIKSEDCGEEFCSECFDLKSEHDCSQLIRWTNPTNAHGFEYENLTFIQYMRIDSILRIASYVEDFNTQITQSDGILKQVAARTRKQFQFIVSQAPEYIHDALEAAFIHKDFRIEGVKHRKLPNDYSPNWRNRILLASSIVDMQKESQPNREITNF